MYAGGIDLIADWANCFSPSRVPPLDQRTGSGEEQHHRRYDSDSGQHVRGVMMAHGML